MEWLLAEKNKTSYNNEVPLNGNDNSSGFTPPEWFYFSNGTIDFPRRDQPFTNFAQAIVDNISSDIGGDHYFFAGERKKLNWSNGTRPSKLHILVSNNLGTSCSNCFPNDIVTACVDSYGTSRKRNNYDQPITGVFKGDHMFSHTKYNFTHGSCLYGITRVNDIFKKDK